MKKKRYSKAIVVLLLTTILLLSLLGCGILEANSFFDNGFYSSYYDSLINATGEFGTGSTALSGKEKNRKKQDFSQAKSATVMIYLNGYKILVTGDLDVAGEKKMIAHYEKSDKLKADILKIGHHGSKTSTSEDLLESVSPRFAVIQVGQNNYGHPDSKIIEKCCLKGIIVLRNDTHGAVGFSFEKNQIKCHEMIKES